MISGHANSRHEPFPRLAADFLGSCHALVDAIQEVEVALTEAAEELAAEHSSQELRWQAKTDNSDEDEARLVQEGAEIHRRATTLQSIEAVLANISTCTYQTGKFWESAKEVMGGEADEDDEDFASGTVSSNSTAINSYGTMQSRSRGWEETPFGLPSLGAELHFSNACTPCKFYRSKRGCYDGVNCKLCHFPHENLTDSGVRRLARQRGLAKHGIALKKNAGALAQDDPDAGSFP